MKTANIRIDIVHIRVEKNEREGSVTFLSFFHFVSQKRCDSGMQKAERSLLHFFKEKTVVGICTVHATWTLGLAWYTWYHAMEKLIWYEWFLEENRESTKLFIVCFVLKIYLQLVLLFCFRNFSFHFSCFCFRIVFLIMVI